MSTNVGPVPGNGIPMPRLHPKSTAGQIQLAVLFFLCIHKNAGFEIALWFGGALDDQIPGVMQILRKLARRGARGKPLFDMTVGIADPQIDLSPSSGSEDSPENVERKVGAIFDQCNSPSLAVVLVMCHFLPESDAPTLLRVLSCVMVHLKTNGWDGENSDQQSLADLAKDSILGSRQIFDSRRQEYKRVPGTGVVLLGLQMICYPFQITQKRKWCLNRDLLDFILLNVSGDLQFLLRALALYGLRPYVKTCIEGIISMLGKHLSATATATQADVDTESKNDGKSKSKSKSKSKRNRKRKGKGKGKGKNEGKDEDKNEDEGKDEDKNEDENEDEGKREGLNGVNGNQSGADSGDVESKVGNSVADEECKQVRCTKAEFLSGDTPKQVVAALAEARAAKAEARAATADAKAAKAEAKAALAEASAEKALAEAKAALAEASAEKALAEAKAALAEVRAAEAKVGAARVRAENAESGARVLQQAVDAGKAAVDAGKAEIEQLQTELGAANACISKLTTAFNIVTKAMRSVSRYIPLPSYEQVIRPNNPDNGGL